MIALQPYGSLFCAAAPVLESKLPAPAGASGNSVVILRLRGRTDLGATFTGVLRRYAQALAARSSKLVIVSAGERVQEQLRVTGVTDVVGAENIYTGDERVAATLKRATQTHRPGYSKTGLTPGPPHRDQRPRQRALPTCHSTNCQNRRRPMHSATLRSRSSTRAKITARDTEPTITSPYERSRPPRSR